MFKFISSEKQLVKERNRSRQLLAQQNKTADMSKIMFVGMSESGSISEENIIKFPEAFEEWTADTHYTVGSIRKYGEDKLLYMCDIEHDSQDGWTPDVVSMWHQIGNPKEEYPAWISPTGAEGAYDLGAKVSHNEKKWVSTIADNVWEPGVYGWDEITE